MLPCFNPKHLALTALLLAVLSARGADAPADTQGGPTAESGPKAPVAVEGNGSISTLGINFATPMQDNYAHGNWMVIEVDFGGKSPPGAIPKWADNVDITLTLGWGKAPQGQPPEIDLAMNATVHLLSVDPGKKNVVFFFVTPETLARGFKGIAIDANRAPTFYVVKYGVSGAPIASAKADYSSTLLNNTWVEGFLKNASAKFVPGLLSEATVPAYVLNSSLGRVGQNVFPTYVSASSDAGH